MAKTIKSIVDLVPTNWLDSILTGKDAVIGRPPYDCKDIQNVLLAVKKRIEHSAVLKNIVKR